MENEMNTTPTVDETAAEATAEAAVESQETAVENTDAAPEASAEEEKSSMADYETELEASFKKLEEGDMVTAVVIAVDDDEVTLDLKSYTEGIIKREDYSREPGFSLKENVQV